MNLLPHSETHEYTIARHVKEIEVNLPVRRHFDLSPEIDKGKSEI
jgi:hypothetical protein